MPTPSKEIGDPCAPLRDAKVASERSQIPANVLELYPNRRPDGQPNLGYSAFRADRKRVMQQGKQTAYLAAQKKTASTPTRTSETLQCKGETGEKIQRSNNQLKNVAAPAAARMYRMQNMKDVRDLIDVVRRRRDGIDTDRRRNPDGIRERRNLSWQLRLLQQQAGVLAGLDATNRKPGLRDLLKYIVTMPFVFRTRVPLEVINTNGRLRKEDSEVILEAFEIQTYEGTSECIEWLEHQIVQLKTSPVHFQPESRRGPGSRCFC